MVRLIWRMRRLLINQVTPAAATPVKRATRSRGAWEEEPIEDLDLFAPVFTSVFASVFAELGLFGVFFPGDDFSELTGAGVVGRGASMPETPLTTNTVKAEVAPAAIAI